MKKINWHYASTTIAILLWSASFIATKFAYTCFSPLMVGFIRFFLAAILLWIARKILKETTPPDKKDRFKIACSGFLGITLYFAAENIGVQLTTASNASLIVASYPAITVLLEFFIYRTKPTLRKVFGILLAIGGVVLLTANSADSGSNALYGNFLLVLAGLLWTFYNFITRSIAEKYSPTTLSYYQMCYGTIGFLPLLLLERQPVSAITATGALAILYLALGCSVGAFLLYNFGLRKLSAAASVSLMNLVPVFGILFSALFLKETITFTQLTGGAIIIAGVLLSSISTKKGQN